MKNNNCIFTIKFLKRLTIFYGFPLSMFLNMHFCNQCITKVEKCLDLHNNNNRIELLFQSYYYNNNYCNYVNYSVKFTKIQI